MKNIHNSAFDAKGNEKVLAQISNDERNKEVLDSRTRVAREASPVATAINWSDRGQRTDVTYRLSFAFFPMKISDRVRENMDPESEAGFEIPLVNLESGRYRTLADARSVQLEYKSRGLTQTEVIAYYKGDPIELLTAIARPVVEK